MYNTWKWHVPIHTGSQSTGFTSMFPVNLHKLWGCHLFSKFIAGTHCWSTLFSHWKFNTRLWYEKGLDRPCVPVSWGIGREDWITEMNKANCLFFNLIPHCHSIVLKPLKIFLSPFSLSSLHLKGFSILIFFLVKNPSFPL